ncbi:MAG: glycyl-radical enzyme activating protein [Pseudomonadota bacterium]
MNTLFANIFAVKRYALHDGPNIRTSVFFKGCPLSCIWCHNPEGIGFTSKILYLAEKCVGCGECIEHCPEKALHFSSKGVNRMDDKCTSCAICVQTCPALAHEATGRRMSIAEIITDIKKEMPFFDQSGGGITCSGGEPLSQPESLQALLQACGQLGIHRALDTSGFAPTATLLNIARYTDLFLYDLKHMDNDTHKRYTGVANDLILSNLQALGNNGHTIRVRIPLIGGVNDDEKNIHATGAFVAGCKGVQGIDLLPYHPSATAKYRKLDLKYEGAHLTTPTKTHIAEVENLLKSYGIEVNIGG